MKFLCLMNVKSENGTYFTKENVYVGYENKHGELYATDDNNKNFNVGINANDDWFQTHFEIIA
jgi:hypothetical protein